MNIAFSQSITGRLVDELASPIEYANVVLLNAKDSTFITGSITNKDGVFYIENKESEGNLLHFSYIGYNEVYYPIANITNNIGTVVMRPKTSALEEVTVTASKPLFREKNGTMITYVSNSVLSQTHEMSELISQIPGIIKTVNGSFNVFGLGSPIIYIDNRKMQNDNELQQLSPKNIKTIELITNPGARYDAEGKAVLKITTIKKEEGLTLQVGGKIKQNNDFSHGENIKLGFKHRNFNISANYDYADTENQSKLPQTKELFTENNTYKYVQDQTAKGKLADHKWQINMDYDINDKQNIGISWNASNYRDKENRFSKLNYFLDDNLFQYMNIFNHYQNKTNYNHINLFHNGKWSKQLLTELNIDYVNNNNKYNQETEETSIEIPTLTVSTGNSLMNIYASKLSFDYKLNNKINFLWGIEYNHIKGKGFLTCDSDKTPSSDYENKEDKYAAFAEITINCKQFTINGGIRYEDLTFNYENNIDKTGNVDRHYRNVYPSISITHNGAEWTNTLSFSSRTSRPTFRQLSNSSYYSNEFMYQCGNPLLKPSTSYIAQWNMGYKIVNFSTSYTYMKDYISTDFYTPDDRQGQIISTYINYDKIQYLKANLNIQKSIAWWKPSLSLGIVKPILEYEYLGNKVSYNSSQIYAVINQYFQLPNSYLFSIYYYYNSGGNQGTVDLKSYQMLNMGIQKAFFNNKLSVSVQAQDILHTMKFKERQQIKNIHFKQIEDYCSWNYSISIIYRLNQLKTKYRGKTSINTEINRL